MASRTAGVKGLGSTALVTGASSGIGAATAELLAEHGLRLAVQSRGGRELETIATRTGAHPFAVDLATEGAAERLHAETTSAIGPVDLLVCNAGAGWEGPLESMSSADIEYLVRLNLQANLQLVRAFSPDMVSMERGHIVLVCSIAGSMGVPGEAVYSATKAGLRVFGDSVRLELAPSGIGVTVVNPGAVRTAFFERRGSPYRRRFPRQVPSAAVANALAGGVLHNKAEVFVPRWLRLAARLQGAAPGPIGALRRGLS